MKLRSLLLPISIIVASQSSAQENFQRTYSFGEQSSIHDIFVTDSAYYFTGSSDEPTDVYDGMFGKLNLAGDLEYAVIDSTPFRRDLGQGSLAQLTPNYQGNLTTAYIIEPFDYSNTKILIKEFNLDGSIIDTIFVDQFVADSVRFKSEMKFIPHNSDSTYYALVTYEDLTPAYSNPVVDERELGAMLLKLDLYGDTIWTKRFKIDWTASNMPWVRAKNLEFLNDSVFLVSVFEERHSPAPNDRWGRMRYYKYDLDGNLLQARLFTDGKVLYGGPGMLQLNDGSIIQAYKDSELNDDNFPDYEPRGVIARVSPYNSIQWKDSLIDDFLEYFYYSTPTRMRFNADSTAFFGAYTLYEIDPNTPYVYHHARIFKRSITGDVIWERDYKIGTFDSVRGDYNLTDFELTPDGGFIAAGMMRTLDISLGYHLPPVGYVLKTNCLGFIEDPTASFELEINENLEIVFTNTSQNAGSFLWDFGDGNYLNTGEDTIPFSHTYAGFGPYTVILTAVGCNGDEDKMTIIVNPVKHLNSKAKVEPHGLFLVFPNPLQSGEGLFVYLNDIDHTQKDIFLDLYSIDGKLIKSILMIGQEGVYPLDSKIGAGNYQAVLRKGSELIQQTKLVIL